MRDTTEWEVRKMKKRTAACAVFLGVTLALSGCATGQISNDHISISRYKGVEVPKVEGIPEITDESVDNNIETVREGFSKTKDVTDRAIQEGDILVIDYAASADGQAIDGGQGTGYELTVGSGSFYEGFDENLIGHAAGDKLKVEHTFAKDYSNTALAGKEATIDVTVRSVKEKELPDLTDEFVQTISQKSDTVEEYREEVKKLLEENNKEYIQTELMDAAWEQVLENTEVKEYPKDRVETEKQSLYDHYREGADMYEMELPEFLSKMDMTEEEFEKKAEEAARSNVKEDLVVELIAEKENIRLDKKEYKKAKKELAEEMGYEDVEAMEKEASADAVRRYILRDKVKEWVAGNCIQAASDN